MTATSHPKPRLTDLTAEFYGHLANGELRLQRCTACGAWRHIPRYLCPLCHSDQWEWALSSGRGSIFSWTTTMRPLHPAFTDVPMTLVTVSMSEGPRLLGRLNGVEPDQVAVGMAVVADISVKANGVALVDFRAA